MPTMTTRRFGLPISLKRADDAGTVEAVFSTSTIIDHAGDRVLSSAFKNGQAVPMVWAHDLDKPIGRGTVRVEPTQAVLAGRFFLETALGREAYQNVKAMGELQQWSFGFIERDSYQGREGERVISALDLMEVSPVVLGANNQTYTASIKSAGGTDIMSVAQRLAARGVMPLPTLDRRSLGERIMASPELKALMAGSSHEARVELDLGVKALVTGLPSPADVRADRLEAVQPAPDFLSFIPILPTESNIVRVISVTATNAAAPTAEATASSGTSGTKPESGLAFPMTEVPVESVPTWIPVTKQILDDAAGLQNVLDTELGQMLRSVVEGQLAAGNGTSPNLHGIATWPGVASIAVGAGGAVAALISALGAVRTTSGRSPTIIGMEAAAYAAMLSATGSGSIGAPGLAGPPSLYGTPIVPCAGLASGTALVGNGPSAALYERQATTVSIGYQGNQFIRNMLTVLAETRVACGVSRPSAWRLVTGLSTS